MRHRAPVLRSSPRPWPPVSGVAFSDPVHAIPDLVLLLIVVSDGHGSADHGTTELLEVAYRFSSAVMSLATGDGSPRRRLIEGWRQLSRVEGALSGLWPEPHVPADLVAQVHELLAQLTARGSMEETVERMDDVAVSRTCQQITSLAFALQQTLGATEPPPA